MDQTEFHIRKYKIDTTRRLNTTEEFKSQYILRLTAQCHLSQESYLAINDSREGQIVKYLSAVSPDCD